MQSFVALTRMATMRSVNFNWLAAVSSVYQFLLLSAGGNLRHCICSAQGAITGALPAHGGANACSGQGAGQEGGRRRSAAPRSRFRLSAPLHMSGPTLNNLTFSEEVSVQTLRHGLPAAFTECVVQVAPLPRREKHCEICLKATTVPSATVQEQNLLHMTRCAHESRGNVKLTVHALR